MKGLIKFILFSACFIVSMELISGNSFEVIYRKTLVAKKRIIKIFTQLENDTFINSERFSESIQNRKQTKRYTEKTKNVIYLAKLGNPDPELFEIAKNEIQNRFGWEVSTGLSIVITSKMLNPSGNINAFETAQILPAKQKTVFITERELEDEEGNKLRGYAFGINHVMIVRGNKHFFIETLIHEIGHTLGLKHCEDKTCIMAENNDSVDSGEFCSRCKSQLKI